MNSKLAINVSPSSHTSQQHWRNSLVQVRGRRSSQQEKSHFYIMKRFLRFCNYAKCPFVRWIHSSQQWMNENEQREILQANGEYEEERRKVIEIHERWKILPKIPWEECYEKIWKMKLKRCERRKKCYNLWIALLSACRLFNFLFTQKYSSSALARSIQLILLLFVTSSHYSANK